MRSPGRPRGVPLVLSLQALVVTLVVAWFATGHASAPDDGLQQLDVLAVHERVPGLAPVGGTLLLGGWGWVAAAYRRRWFASALSVTALVLLLIACLMARLLPSRLSDFPHATAPLGVAR